jgi:ketosteroid isomerase-like protein
LERLLELLSPNATLIAPTTPAKSIGRAAGRRAFERTFAALPDLRAEVLRWSASGDTVFIEIAYSATIGQRLTRWRAVDRFIFAQGEAIERIAYFNPAKVQRDLLRNPTGWRQLIRLRTGWGV